MARDDPPTDHTALRATFRDPQNLDRLLFVLYRYVRDPFLAFFAPDAAPEETDDMALRIATALRAAILEKLARQHPNDRHREPTDLLRYNAKRAVRLTQEAQAVLLDCWLKDIEAVRRDPVSRRCRRLVPVLYRLPDRRGKSAVGDVHHLVYFAVYETAHHRLEELPLPSLTLTSPKSIGRRVRALEEWLAALPPGTQPETCGLAIAPHVTVDIPADPASVAWWATLPQQDIACEIAVRALPHLPRLSAERLKRLLPDLLRVTSRLEKPLTFI